MTTFDTTPDPPSSQQQRTLKLPKVVEAHVVGRTFAAGESRALSRGLRQRVTETPTHRFS